MAQDQGSRLHAEGRQGRPIRLVTAAHMEAGRRSVRTESTIAKRCPLNFEEARSQWEVEKKKFLGANFGCLRDVSPAVLKAFRAALSEGPEEAIQKVITANPYLIQYAVARSGHQGIWVYPKAMIKPPGTDGTPGLIPDYLIATRSSLGYFWHVVELKRFDVQFANSDGIGLSSEGTQGHCSMSGVSTAA
jgi:hypothetical protein